MKHRGQHQAARSHLQQPEHENIAPHPPQSRRFQFQPDQKQQQRYAQFGNAHFLFGIAHQVQALRPDHHAREQITQCRTEPEPTKQQPKAQRKAKQQETIV